MQIASDTAYRECCQGKMMLCGKHAETAANLQSLQQQSAW
jgi:hypothetical protein